MGFDVNRFIDLKSDLAENLTCPICRDIFDNPINTSCKHTFCKPCVQENVEKNEKKCSYSNCGKEFTRKRSTVEDPIFVGAYVFSPNIVIKGLINNLKIKCDYEPNGCKTSIEFSALTSHLNKCEHRLCPKCGLTLRQVGHNCIKLLKKNQKKLMATNVRLQQQIQTNNSNVSQTELKDKFENSQRANKILADKVLTLEEWKNKYQNQRNLIRGLNEKITKLEEELEKKVNRETELRHKISNLENQLQLRQQQHQMSASYLMGSTNSTNIPNSNIYGFPINNGNGMTTSNSLPNQMSGMVTNPMLNQLGYSTTNGFQSLVFNPPLTPNNPFLSYVFQ